MGYKKGDKLICEICHEEYELRYSIPQLKRCCYKKDCNERLIRRRNKENKAKYHKRVTDKNQRRCQYKLEDGNICARPLQKGHYFLCNMHFSNPEIEEI